MPLLVGLVLHWSASPRIKAVANAVLSFVAALLVVLSQHHGVVTKQVLISFAVTYVVSGSMHAHLWSPTGITELVQRKTPGLFKNARIKELDALYVGYKQKAERIRESAQDAIKNMTPEQRAAASDELHRIIVGQIPVPWTAEQAAVDAQAWVNDHAGNPPVVLAEDVGFAAVDPAVLDRINAGFAKAAELLNRG